jgi:uncharacterized protein
MPACTLVPMLTSTALVVVSGALAGGFISGLAGFGTGLVALGIWLHVLSPASAATLVIICSVIAQLQTLPAIWHAIDWVRLLPMLLAGLLGVPAGTLLLVYLPPMNIRLAIGILLLAFSGFMLFGRIESRITWGGRGADSIVGFVGGFLGGLAGLSGPLPTIWATLRGWAKDERRGVFQAFNLTTLGAALVTHAVSGFLTADVARLTLIALPGTLLGSYAGIRAYRVLSGHHFHRVVLGLLGVSGLSLVWSSL